MGINVPIHPIFQMRLGEPALSDFPPGNETEIKAGEAGDNEELARKWSGTW